MKPAKHKEIAVSRRIAVEVLRRVEAEGAFASLALNHALQRAPGMLPADRALTTEIVYGTLRWRRRLDYALAAHCHRTIEKIEPSLLRILRVSAYQLMFLDRIPVWAAVDQGTELASQIRGKHAASFVNAVLRGLATNHDRIEWPDPTINLVHSLAVTYSFPDWIIEWWLKALGPERTIQLAQSFNQPAPLWVRANTLRGTADNLCSLLAASGYDAKGSDLVPGAILLRAVSDVTSLAAHQTGLFHVQDAAAQAICQMLDPRQGHRILDACSAPGGKAATIAQLIKNEGEVYSVDIHPARVGLIRKLIDRLGISCVKTFAEDLTSFPLGQWGMFDRILLDAPCSSMGTFRRHPERKWNLAPEDTKRLAQIQRKLLDAVSTALRPGGYLVYSVCTFSEAEGWELIRAWLADHPNFECASPKSSKNTPWHNLIDNEGALRSWPDLHNMDAFFALRLVRKT